MPLKSREGSGFVVSGTDPEPDPHQTTDGTLYKSCKYTKIKSRYVSALALE
jgi:hypothetical protein